jgi:hypothetical protein
MLGSRAREQGRKLASEFRVFRTPKVPEGRGIYRFVKTKNLFDTAVAVGGDDKILPRKARLGVWDSDHHVVMKLPLLVMDEQIIGTPGPTDGLEKRAKHALPGKFLHESFGGLHHQSNMTCFGPWTTTNDADDVRLLASSAAACGHPLVYISKQPADHGLLRPAPEVAVECPNTVLARHGKTHGAR